MNIAQAVNGFCLDRKARGYSPRTIQLYEHNLSVLVEFLQNKDIHEVSNEDIVKFFVFLREDYKPNRFGGDTSPLSPASVDNYWIATRSFFHWASEELGAGRPDKTVPKPQYKNPVRKPFTKQEVLYIVKASTTKTVEAEDGRDGWSYKLPLADRNKAVILLLLDTGMRLGELARLKRGDLDLEAGDITIRPHNAGKKSRPRTIPLGNATIKVLWKYLSSKEHLSEEDSLFGVTDHTIRGMIKRTGTRAGVDNVYPHRFRHTFAIEYLRNGGDVYTLKYFLGHSSLEMVQGYLNIARDDRKAAHRRASPADRWMGP